MKKKKEESIKYLYYCLNCKEPTLNIYKENKMCAPICNNCLTNIQNINLTSYNVIYNKRNKKRN